MKPFLPALLAIALAGCGVESTTAVATGAAIKKQELEEGKKTQERMQQQIDQAMEQAQRRAQQAEGAGAK